MTVREQQLGYVVNPRFSQEDWDEVSDTPELTEKDFAQAQPLEEGAPDLAAAIRRTRDELRASAGNEALIRVDSRVIEYFKATGEGWQERINAILLEAAGF